MPISIFFKTNWSDWRAWCQDISHRPLPANGTVIVDITEADDIDIETIPPEGVTIVMTNTTITVTNEDIETPDQDDEDSGTDEDEDDEDEG